MEQLHLSTFRSILYRTQRRDTVPVLDAIRLLQLSHELLEKNVALHQTCP